MPIFEFRCGDCGATFEKLTKADWKKEAITCTGCEGKNIIKLVSSFCSPGTGGGSGCSGCSGGDCSSCH